MSGGKNERRLLKITRPKMVWRPVKNKKKRLCKTFLRLFDKTIVRFVLILVGVLVPRSYYIQQPFERHSNLPYSTNDNAACLASPFNRNTIVAAKRFTDKSITCMHNIMCEFLAASRCLFRSQTP